MKLQTVFDDFLHALENMSRDELRDRYLQAIEDTSDSYLMGEIDGSDESDCFECIARTKVQTLPAPNHRKPVLSSTSQDTVRQYDENDDYRGVAA